MRRSSGICGFAGEILKGKDLSGEWIFNVCNRLNIMIKAHNSLLPQLGAFSQGVFQITG